MKRRAEHSASEEYWHVLVTGPLNGLEEWVDAARGAGWQATALPLLTVEMTGEALLAPQAPCPDWIVISSSNAVEPLAAAVQTRPELREARLLCVGPATAQRIRQAGLGEALVPAPGAQDAEGLARALLQVAQPGETVLWPRGQRARLLGERLEEAGLVVKAPVVYRTRPIALEAEPPTCDAVFFASPSAVQAWNPPARRTRPAAIAIGWTTYDALDPFEEFFSMMLPLVNPSPGSFQDCLRSFFPSE